VFTNTFVCANTLGSRGLFVGARVIIRGLDRLAARRKIPLVEKVIFGALENRAETP